MRGRNGMTGLTRWVLAHKRLVVGLWIAVFPQIVLLLPANF
jgi:hypothetical protein